MVALADFGVGSGTGGMAVVSGVDGVVGLRYCNEAGAGVGAGLEGGWWLASQLSMNACLGVDGEAMLVVTAR